LKRRKEREKNNNLLVLKYIYSSTSARKKEKGRYCRLLQVQKGKNNTAVISSSNPSVSGQGGKERGTRTGNRTIREGYSLRRKKRRGRGGRETFPAEGKREKETHHLLGEGKRPLLLPPL